MSHRRYPSAEDADDRRKVSFEVREVLSLLTALQDRTPGQEQRHVR